MNKFRMLSAAVVMGVSALVSMPASAQVYFGVEPRPPVIDRGYDDDRFERRRAWRERREMERREMYGRGPRDGYGDRRGVRCRIVTIRDRDDWGRRICPPRTRLQLRSKVAERKTPGEIRVCFP